MKNYDNIADLNWAISIITLNIRKENIKFTNSAQMDKRLNYILSNRDVV